MKQQTFFFDQDDSGHWYMIPTERGAEWDKWQGVDIDKGDNYKKWCDSGFGDYRTGGGISDIEFIPIT